MARCGCCDENPCLCDDGEIGRRNRREDEARRTRERIQRGAISRWNALSPSARRLACALVIETLDRRSADAREGLAALVELGRAFSPDTIPATSSHEEEK